MGYMSQRYFQNYSQLDLQKVIKGNSKNKIKALTDNKLIKLQFYVIEFQNISCNMD